MKICIAGAGGFIGKHLVKELKNAGYQVLPLSRLLLERGGKVLETIMNDTNVVINLAGENIAGRWTAKKKKRMMQSRVETTRRLVTALIGVEHPPSLWINASAVGIYRDRTVCDEMEDKTGTDFLAQLTRAWEQELQPLVGIRTVILRLGIVIGSGGGIMKKLRISSRFHIPLIPGSGTQPFPVIHIRDVTGFIKYAIDHQNVRGIYNLVLPETVDYIRFADIVSGNTGKARRIHLPVWLLRSVLGDGASVLTSGAYVIPRRLLTSGYTLRYPGLFEALNEVLEQEKTP